MSGPPPAPCGTAQAYQRHLYWKEEPCDPCRLAHNAEMREYQVAQRRRRPARGPTFSERAKCPGCGEMILLNRDGRIRMHQAPVMSTWGGYDNCTGAHELPSR